jgi:hypothetical protein
MRAVLLSALLLCASALGGQAAPNKVQYELQERCGKQASAAFDKGWQDGSTTNTENGQMIGSYRNHYSPKLNKCFYLETALSLEYKKTPKSITTLIQLYDINENKQYAEFYKLDNKVVRCQVVGQLCASDKEWEELLKPYMDEDD